MGNYDNKRRRIYFILGFILVFIIIVLFLINSSMIFALKNVYLQGNKNLNFEYVFSIAGFKYGMSLININQQKVKEILTLNPYIEKANVKILFPDTIKINIIERIPIVFVSLDNKGYLLDKYAVIIEKINMPYGKFDFLRIELKGRNTINYLVGDKLTIPIVNELIDFLVEFEKENLIINKIDYIKLNYAESNVYLKFKDLNTIFEFPEGIKNISYLKKAKLIYDNIKKTKDKINHISISDFIVGKQK